MKGMTTMNPLLSINPIYAAIGAAFIGLSIYTTVLKHEVASQKTIIESYVIQSKVAQAETKILDKETTSVADNASIDYNKKVKEIKDYYAKHPSIKHVYVPYGVLQQPTSTPSGEATVPEDTTGVDGTTTNPLLVDCTLTTEQLESLQQVITEDKEVWDATNP